MEIRYGQSLEYSQNWTDCDSGPNKICIKTINLSIFNGLEIKYELTLRDFNHNVSSGVYILRVDRNAPVVSITEPLGGYLGDRRVRLSATVNETVDEVLVSIDGKRFNRVCSDCNSFSKVYSLSDTSHLLVVKAVDYAGNIGEAGVPFIVDSKEPRIKNTEPRTNSNVNNTNLFTVVYSEEHLAGVSIHYGISGDDRVSVLPWCTGGTNHECSIPLNLTDFDGKMIYYYFNLTDQITSAVSRRLYVSIDTTPPNRGYNLSNWNCCLWQNFIEGNIKRTLNHAVFS